MAAHATAHGAIRILAAIAALLLTIGGVSWVSASMRVADAETRIRAALDARGLGDVQFTMHGLDVEIAAAPSAEALAEANQIISSVEGTGQLSAAPEAVPAAPEASPDTADAPSAPEQSAVQPAPPTQAITFAPDSAVIDENGNAIVASVAAYLTAHPEVRILVIGHTAPLGDSETNDSLSSDRARAVADALMLQGIAPERIAAEGHGDHEPVTTNPADPGYQANRRVNFSYEGG